MCTHTGFENARNIWIRSGGKEGGCQHYIKKGKGEQSWLGCRIVNTTRAKGDKPGAISRYLLYAILKATPRGGDEIEMALIIAVITCRGNTRMIYTREERTSENFACL